MSASTCDLVDAGRIRAAAGRILPRPGARHRGAARRRRCSCSARTRPMRRRATLDFAALYATVPLRIHAGSHADETADAQPLAPAAAARARGLERRALAGRHGDDHPAGRSQPLYDSRSLHSIVAALTCDAAPHRARDSCGRPGRAQLAGDDAWECRAEDAGSSRRLAAQRLVADCAAATPRPPASRAARRGRDRVPARPDDPRRQLRQQRLAAGAAQAAVQDDLGQCRRDQPERSRRELRSTAATCVEVQSGGRAIEGPAWVLPGQPPNVVTLFLGYGRRAAGESATASATTPTRCAPPHSPWTARGSDPAGPAAASSSPTTQMHHLLDGEGADLVRTVTPDAALGASREPIATRTASIPPGRRATAGLGHGDRPRPLHRLQRLRRRLPGREQRAGGRQGPGRARARDALAARRPLLRRRAGRPATLLPAGAVHALREGAVRDGLPGARHGAQPRGPQPDGLQPLHRHAHLLELLPLQGAALQLVRLHAARRAEPRSAAQSRRHRARRAASWRNAPTASSASRPRTSQADKENRPIRDGEVDDRLPAGLPDQGDQLRQSRTTEERRSRKQRSSGRAITRCSEELGTRPRTTYLARWNDERRTAMASDVARRFPLDADACATSPTQLARHPAAFPGAACRG